MNARRKAILRQMQLQVKACNEGYMPFIPRVGTILFDVWQHHGTDGYLKQSPDFNRKWKAEEFARDLRKQVRKDLQSGKHNEHWMLRIRVHRYCWTQRDTDEMLSEVY